MNNDKDTLSPKDAYGYGMFIGLVIGIILGIVLF